MKRNYVDISVSTDPISDYQEIIEYTKMLQGEADFIHCDVMDGLFVPKKTYEHTVVDSINQNTLTMLDVHLMVKEPMEQLENYIRAGANILTVHYEAFEDKELLTKALKYIQSRGVLAGLAFNPSTPFTDVKLFCYDIDLLLVMSVEPGASGQKMIANISSRIKNIFDFRQANNLNFKIEVDGGVNDENAQSLIEAGADMLVSGSYVFKSKDRKEAISQLKKFKV